jgi:hypothetical protein
MKRISNIIRGDKPKISQSFYDMSKRRKKCEAIRPCQINAAMITEKRVKLENEQSMLTNTSQARPLKHRVEPKGQSIPNFG